MKKIEEKHTVCISTFSYGGLFAVLVLSSRAPGLFFFTHKLQFSYIKLKCSLFLCLTEIETKD